jgi:hypothetical protein
MSENLDGLVSSVKSGDAALEAWGADMHTKLGEAGSQLSEMQSANATLISDTQASLAAGKN